MQQKVSDTNFLVNNQYDNSSRLEVRVRLHEECSQSTKNWYEWLISLVRPQEEDTVLDIGCGFGALWKRNVELLPAQIQLILMDISPAMIEAAKQEFPFDNVDWRVQDARSLKLKNKSVDIAFATHMLHHQNTPSHIISEVSRILKPNGSFIAATNGTKHMAKLHELVRESTARAETEFSNFNKFNLENGLPILSKFFERVDTYIYEDALLVHDPSILIEAITSEGHFSNSEMESLRNNIEIKIQREGYIYIPKHVGAFVCREPK